MEELRYAFVMFIELGFKLQCFTPTQLFQSCFLLMEVSIGQMFHFPSP